MLKKALIALGLVGITGSGYWGYVSYRDYQKQEYIRLLKERDESIARMIIEQRENLIKQEQDKIREEEEEVARQLRIANGNPIIEEKTTYYPGSQKKKAQFTLLEGKVEGIKTMWYFNGNKEIETNYKNGLKNGVETKWLENGQKKSEISYKDDLKDGLSTYWDENGDKSSETEYKDNKNHGKDLDYDKGVLVEEKYYVEGKLHGIHRIYNKYSKTVDAFYQNGLREGAYLELYNKNKVEDSFYKLGKRHGIYKTRYLNNDPKEEYYYVDGLLDGDNYSWDGEERNLVGNSAANRSNYHEIYDMNRLIKVSSTYSTGEPRSLEEYIPEEDRIKVTQWYKDGAVSMEAYKRQVENKYGDAPAFVFVDFVRFYAQNGQLLLEAFYNGQGEKSGKCTKWIAGNSTYPSDIIEYDDTGMKGWRYDYKVIRGGTNCQLSDEELKQIFGAKFGKFIPYTHVSNIND
ncbi:toxin-antitoxin system YwqK family antitoxin [Wohlfahrtiimonas populi]|uniref:toxin-antitoxin system YwqK family antitoxin n=1 Tax=Wohlfahrtiimonas populi TaxID=1940240 RepID=UPI00098D19EB|nr:toxin-antitoxin system YwqK family antitoxin [Wohlfahrtiimonas populi]